MLFINLVAALAELTLPQPLHATEINKGNLSFLSKNNITGMVDTTESMFNFNKFETHVIRGEEKNLKITYKNDLEIIQKEII